MCHIHFCRAWQLGTVIFNGARIQLFPDLSGNTLPRRDILNPLLEKIHDSGATCKWGYPLHLIIKKDIATMYVHSIEDIPLLFEELGIEPFQHDD